MANYILKDKSFSISWSNSRPIGYYNTTFGPVFMCFSHARMLSCSCKI